MKCGLCSSESREEFYVCGKRGTYWNCLHCGYIWLDSQGWLSEEKEKQRYLLHENSIEDAGYISHLRQLADLVWDFLPRERCLGLDFGSGPVEGMRKLAAARGHEVESYDPFFFPLPLNNRKCIYDFVLCSEAIEHFHFPGKELSKIAEVSKPEAIWGFKSSLVVERKDFPHWYYRSDSSHIGFFSPKSVEWMATKFGKKIYRLESSIWILG